MAVPKSVRERISRKTRLKKATPTGIDMPGRIVVKKTADNDPNNSELDLEEKKKFTEDIIKFYRGGEPIIDEAVIEFLDLLIDESIESSGSYPFNIERLNEMKDIVNSKLAVIKEDVDKPEIELNFKITTKNQATAQGLKDLINTLSKLGGLGCSREVKTYFDGDGHNRFKISEFSVTGVELKDTETNLDKDIISIDSFG